MYVITSLFSGSPLAYSLAAIAAVVLLVAITGSMLRFKGRRSGKAMKRLELVEAERVDRNRHVVLIRRDNVEHLLLIGGPVDLLIETRGNLPSPAPARSGPTKPSQMDNETPASIYTMSRPASGTAAPAIISRKTVVNR